MATLDIVIVATCPAVSTAVCFHARAAKGWDAVPEPTPPMMYDLMALMVNLDAGAMVASTAAE